MKAITLICPYCAAPNKAVPVRSGFFQTDCVSCTCIFGIDALLPDWSDTFKLDGQPEIVPDYLLVFLKVKK